MKNALCFNDLVVLRANRTDDCVFYTTRQNTIKKKTQYAKLGRQKFASSGSAALDEAFEIEAVLQESINVRLNKSGVQSIIAEASSNPHRTYSSVNGVLLSVCISKVATTVGLQSIQEYFQGVLFLDHLDKKENKAYRHAE